MQNLPDSLFVGGGIIGKWKLDSIWNQTHNEYYQNKDSILYAFSNTGKLIIQGDIAVTFLEYYPTPQQGIYSYSYTVRDSISNPKRSPSFWKWPNVTYEYSGSFVIAKHVSEKPMYVYIAPKNLWIYGSQDGPFLYFTKVN